MKTIQEAKDLGAKAFLAGKPSIPALDPAINVLTKPYGISKKTQKLLKAWLEGWHAENLKA